MTTLSVQPGPFSLLAEDANALDEVEVALKVDRLVFPQADEQATRDALAQVKNAVLRQADALREPWLGLARLGFRGNTGSYDSADNSSLSWVLAQRQGIPISLAVVLIAVARAAGCAAEGLNNPGHFLVRVNDVLVDPFHMTLLPESAESYDQASRSPAASARDLALRMLNNLKHGAVQRQDFANALNLLDQQLSIFPRAWDLWFEKAAYWQQLGSRSSALAICGDLLKQELPPALLSAVQGLQSQLNNLPPEVLH